MSSSYMYSTFMYCTYIYVWAHVCRPGPTNFDRESFNKLLLLLGEVFFSIICSYVFCSAVSSVYSLNVPGMSAVGQVEAEPDEDAPSTSSPSSLSGHAQVRDVP